jgi:hypothetical protein
MRQGQSAIAGGEVSRRELIKRAAGIAGMVAISAVIRRRAYAAEERGTVKVVPEVDLKILDPVWTTAFDHRHPRESRL